MLFELELGQHHQHILDQARADTYRWKADGKKTAGSVRSARLRAHFSEEQRQWWFEVQIAIGIKPDNIKQPEHVIGVHVDPFKGWFVTVLCLDGTVKAQFSLDEKTIAAWIGTVVLQS